MESRGGSTVDWNSEESNAPIFAIPALPPQPPEYEQKTENKEGFKTAKPTFEPVRVHFAINNGDLVAVQKYVNEGISLNYIIHGNTPLTLAILKDQFEIAHVLIDGGADVTIPEKTKWKRRPIHLAACVGDVELLQKIVSRGESVNICDTTELTALHWASLHGHDNAVKFLIDAGANINVQDDAGRTSLHRASENGHLQVVDILIKAGAQINQQDKRGWTALFQPVACNDYAMVEQLLSKGIDPNLEDYNGETALHINANRMKGRNILVLCRTDINIYTRHLAFVNAAVQRAQQSLGYDLEITSILINYGANVNKLNRTGESCSLIAAQEGYGAIIKLLYQAGANLAAEDWIQKMNWPQKLIDSSTEVCTWLSKEVFAKPRTLQEICKFEIREAIKRNINELCDMLPLPKKITTYLKVEI